jgi:hypothetical protein
MACAACHHSFSFREAARLHNPLSFACPNCGVRLTLDKPGWAFLGLAVLLAAWVTRSAAVQYRTGAWSLADCLLVLLIFILATGLAEALYLRVARFRLKQRGP